MRRIVAIGLIGVGVALTVLALMMRFYAYPRVATVPIDQDSVSISEGTDMDVLFIREEGIRVLEDTTVTSTRVVKGNAERTAEGGGDTDVFWETAVRSVATEGELTTTVEGVSFDRVSGEATNCCGDYVEAEEGKREDIEHQGLFFKFPFDTQRQDYQFWDGDLQAATTAEYSGAEDIEGVQTYRFVQVIRDTVVDTRDVPGSLFGEEGTLTAELVYGTTRTLWVEPRTGVIIKGQEEINKRLVADGVAVPATVGTIGYREDTVTANADEWGGKSGQLNLVKNTIPLVGGILGPLMVAGGIVLLVMGRREDDGGQAASERRVTAGAS